MTNNDVLRRLRYTFDFSDAKMVEIFAQAPYAVTAKQVDGWLRPDDSPAFERCSDEQLGQFLTGLIHHKRGKAEGPPPPVALQINNNAILRKLRIALDLKEAGMLEILEKGGMQVSKHELSALFRRPDHKHYRECQDQLLRTFLKGLQLTYRGHSE